MVKYLKSSVLTFLATIAIFTLAPFQSMISYAGNAHLSFALLLSSVAALMTNKIPIGISAIKILLNPYTLLSIVILFIAISTYPSSATFYWTIITLNFLHSIRISFPHIRSQTFNYFFVGISSLILYALTLQITKPLFPSPTNPLDHFIYQPKITQDILGKLEWFFNEPLINALNLWQIYPSKIWTSFIIVFIFLMLFSSLFKRKEEAFLNNEEMKFQHFLFYTIVLISLVLLSFAPNLLAEANAAFYRCLAALSSIILILLVFLINENLTYFPVSKRQMIMTLTLITMFAFGSYRAYSNVLNYRVIPSHKEFKYLKSNIKKAIADKKEIIQIIRPKTPALNMQNRYDEFGTLTTNFIYDLVPLVNAIVQDIGQDEELELIDFWFQEDGKINYRFRNNQQKEIVRKLGISTNIANKKFSFDEPVYIIDMNDLYKP